MLCRIQEELEIQDRQRDVQIPIKQHYLLGTRITSKYSGYRHIDFLFQHLTYDETNDQLRIHEDVVRTPKVIDCWVFLFRCGFSFEQKAPSGTFFVYDWCYLDWLRRLGNDHILYFFAESALTVNYAILENVVKQMFIHRNHICNIPSNILKEGALIDNTFVVLSHNTIGLLAAKSRKVQTSLLEQYATQKNMWIATPNSKKHMSCSVLHALFLWVVALRISIRHTEHVTKEHYEKNQTFLQWDQDQCFAI